MDKKSILAMPFLITLMVVMLLITFHVEEAVGQIEINCEGSDTHCVTIEEYNIIVHGENPRVIIH